MHRSSHQHKVQNIKLNYALLQGFFSCFISFFFLFLVSVILMARQIALCYSTYIPNPERAHRSQRLGARSLGVSLIPRDIPPITEWMVNGINGHFALSLGALYPRGGYFRYRWDRPLGSLWAPTFQEWGGLLRRKVPWALQRLIGRVYQCSY